MEEIKSHTAKIDYGKCLEMSGVADVTAFNEGEIRVALLNGHKAQISGDKLKIAGFSKQSGDLKVLGSVYYIKYSQYNKGGLKGFFK